MGETLMPRKKKKKINAKKEPPERRFNCINYDPCLTSAALANKELDCGRCHVFRAYPDHYQCLESGLARLDADDFFYLPEKICAKVGLI